MTPLPRSVATLCSVTAVSGLLAAPPAIGAGAAAQTTSAPPACTVIGTPGDDVITGTPGDDVICGLEGKDQIDAEGGNDVLHGGPGDDRLDGDDGDDVASYETAAVGVVGDLSLGTASGEGADVLDAVESLTGSSGEDVLTGSAARNTLSGLGGTDLLFGGGGADSLLGGDGEDYLTASEGSLLEGGAESDTCFPGSGPVVLISCLSPSPADENDAHGFLDVKQVASFLGSEEPVWRVVTISRWSVFRMWDRGFVLVHLDTFGASVPDYYVLIRSVGSRLRATLYRNAHRVAPVSVWRPSRRSVSVRIPFDKVLVGADRRFYRWRVVTMTDRCRRTCFDQIPDEGALIQPFAARSG